MSFTYHYGLHAIIAKDARVLNVNAVEDAGFAIQEMFKIEEFEAREVFPAGAETLTGGRDDGPFSFVWEGPDAAGYEDASPEGLLELAPTILEGFLGSVPNLADIPHPMADILVPNLPPLAEDSAFMDLLSWNRELEYGEHSFGRTVNVGSLDAALKALAEKRQDEHNAEWFEVYDDLIEAMRVAQKYSLFFTFQF